MNMLTISIDFANNIFFLHDIDLAGKAVFIKSKVVRGQVLEIGADRFSYQA